MDHNKEGRVAGFGNAKKDQMRSDSNNKKNHSDIENHIKTAEYFQLASKYHYEASRYHQEGNHELANQSALRATGYSHMAIRCQQADAKHHALEDL